MPVLLQLAVLPSQCLAHCRCSKCAEVSHASGEERQTPCTFVSVIKYVLKVKLGFGHRAVMGAKIKRGDYVLSPSPFLTKITV